VNAPAVNDDNFGAVIDRAWPQRGEGRADLRLFIERGNDNADRHTVCGLRRAARIIPARYKRGFRRFTEAGLKFRGPSLSLLQCVIAPLIAVEDKAGAI